MKTKILVIDDDKAVRNSFMLTFEDSEFEIEVAKNGEVGLEMILKNDYNLVFLDLKMPGLNGVEVLRKIKKTDHDIPVYIITAFHKEYFKDLQLALNEGIDFEIIQKPLNSMQLLGVVDCITQNLI